MLEKEIIQEHGFRNVRKNGQIVGFQVRYRSCYYRSVWLSMSPRLRRVRRRRDVLEGPDHRDHRRQDLHAGGDEDDHRRAVAHFRGRDSDGGQAGRAEAGRARGRGRVGARCLVHADGNGRHASPAAVALTWAPPCAACSRSPRNGRSCWWSESGEPTETDMMTRDDAKGVPEDGSWSAMAVAALPGTTSAAPEKPGPKRGVSIYSYSDDIFKTATLEDCLAAVGDLAGDGEEIGLEILANSHIEGYPNPSDAWVAKWFELCKRVPPQAGGIRPLGGLEAAQREGAVAEHQGVLRDAGARHQARQQAGIHLRADQAGRDRRTTDPGAELAGVHQDGAAGRREAQLPHDAGDPPADAAEVEDDRRLRGLHREGEDHALVRPQHRLRRVPESALTGQRDAGPRRAGRRDARAAGRAPGAAWAARPWSRPRSKT